MILHNRLKSVKMTRSDTVTDYLMKVTYICDQLVAVGEKVEEKELVNRALKGHADPYSHMGWYIRSIVIRIGTKFHTIVRTDSYSCT